MGLTRPRAHQLQDAVFKEACLAISTSNVTLSGGAPATVDGVSVSVGDRILVQGQSAGAENGIYRVTVVGSGSNGTWVRTSDADSGDIKAGMQVMVTEGTTYADSVWKLTTDDPITVGSTSLTFEQSSAYAFGTVTVDGTSLVADSVGDTLTISAGNNISLSSVAGTDTFTIAVADAPTFSGNLTAGNLITTGTVEVDRLSLSSSQTTVSPLLLTASSLQDGVGALRIEGAQADIFLNPATATHTTVTFAVNDDQRAAFGMDNNSDFYITRRTGGSWYDDTLVIDRDTGDVALGYTLTATGNITGGNLVTSADVTTATVTASGNVTGGNLITGAQVVATGNVTGGNLVTSADVTTATVTATGNITGGNVLSSGAIHTGNNGVVRFYDSDGSNYVEFRSQSTVASNLQFKWPAADGTSGQVIQTDGAGTLSFATASGGGGASGFQSSTITTHPAAGGDEDLATGPNDDTAETPFESGAQDAFGVSLGTVYDQMEPIGSTTTIDLGDSEAYVGA